VRAENVDEFKLTVGSRYPERTGREPEIYVCLAARGAERVG
jgi:galactokinase